MRARSRILKRLAHAAKRSSGASSRRSRSPVAALHSQTSTPSPLGGDAARIWKKEGTVFLTQRGPSILMPRPCRSPTARQGGAARAVRRGCGGGGGGVASRASGSVYEASMKRL